MAIQSRRAKEIEAYIESHKPACLRGKQKVEINGHIEQLDSFMIPIKYLQYNHDNRRFNLEILECESQIGRKLDPSVKEDIVKIKELILQDQSEKDKLKEDFKQIGEQREVAAITHDGIVINGNRRMAVIEELHVEEPTGKWTELWVVRLPEVISEKDLWKIEAGLQLSKQKVADYGPINNLLMINEGKKAGLNFEEIAASMYGWTAEQVESDLERLYLIDIFLDFFGQRNNYGLIKKFRLAEHFIDIQKYLVDKLKTNGISKRVLIKKLEIVFLYLRAAIVKPDVVSITHYDVREICKILQYDKATDALTDSFGKHKAFNQISPETLIDNLDKAKDVKKNHEDALKPGKLIDRAITALSGIDRKSKHFKEDNDVKVKLKKVVSIVKDLQKDLGLKP